MKKHDSLKDLLIGIVGKPNTGKSTFFNAVTMSSVPVANYPFTTIDAHVGIAYVKKRCVCREFNVKDNPKNSQCIEGYRFIPFKIVDTAGLVPEAWKGRGLGNQFLDKISRADALIHVIDASGSTDEEGNVLKPGQHDPLKDIKFLEEELAKWFEGLILRDWDKILVKCKTLRQPIYLGLYEKLCGLNFNKHQIKEAIENIGRDPHDPKALSREEVSIFVQSLLRLSRPVIIAGNKAECEVAVENIERIKEEGFDVIPTSALSELILRKAAEKGIVKYIPGENEFQIIDEVRATKDQLKGLRRIEEDVLKRWGNTGVQQVINHIVLDVLKWVVVYPVRDPERLTDSDGNVLPDVFLIPPNSTGKELAGRIHSELAGRISYLIDIRRKVRRSVDYILRDNDVISIVTS